MTYMKAFPSASALAVCSLLSAAGEGPLAFGGVNWTPWRTKFEMRGAKLVSLPAAQPGFNYGHSGNGRGATLVTNIGSADWRDYSVEFELGMGGVDPAFNPFMLGPDYRAASIGFHVADAIHTIFRGAVLEFPATGS